MLGDTEDILARLSWLGTNKVEDDYSMLDDNENSLGEAEAVPRRGESLFATPIRHGGGGTPLGTLGGGKRDGIGFTVRGHTKGSLPPCLKTVLGLPQRANC